MMRAAVGDFKHFWRVVAFYGCAIANSRLIMFSTIPVSVYSWLPVAILAEKA